MWRTRQSNPCMFLTLKGLPRVLPRVSPKVSGSPVARYRCAGPATSRVI
jgi:hypothetical protein